jgi:hypothetical protein
MPDARRLVITDELRHAGWKALVDALGPTNATRFILQYEPGCGDYARMRDDLLGAKSVDELYAEMKKEGQSS